MLGTDQDRTEQQLGQSALAEAMGLIFQLSAKALPAVDGEKDPMARREMLELGRACYRIPNAAVRKRIAELTKAMARTAK